MSFLEPEGFTIGPARIANDAPVYVVAEIGVNHDGRVDVARELIHAAADAEADAVKFQVFSADRLVARNAPAAAYQQSATSATTQYELLKNLELSERDFADLAAYAGQCGVEFVATPFSVEDLNFLVDLGVRVLKIASPDIVHIPLLEAAAASHLPIIASTGTANEDEIAEALQIFARPDAGALALLHCVSSYPTREEDANLRAIRALGETFELPVGFSDHTASLTMGSFAAAAGAVIIEKHITLDRGRPGPDHGFSLEPHQMAEYIRSIRATEQLLGDGRIEPASCESEVRQLARRSVVAAREIPKGTRITSELLTLKRPAGGIAPRDLYRLIGCVAAETIPADGLLSWARVLDPTPALDATPS